MRKENHMINDMKLIGLRNVYYRYVKANKYPFYKKKCLDRNVVKFKNSRKGGACFIVGNGPSLTVKDLDRIMELGVPCFAANGIYNLFEKTKWRPTYLVFQDQQMINGLVELFGELSSCCEYLFVRRDAYHQVAKEIRDNGKIIYPRLVMHIRKDMYYDFSEDIEKYAFDGCTVTYLMMQLAYYMGFTTIYLIGVDHSFPISFDKNDNVVTNHDVKMHCFEDASHVIVNPARILETTYAYRSARRFLEGRGVSIYNATRGGELDIFIRKELDTILR